MNRKKLRFVVSSMSVLLAVNSPAVTLAAQSQDTFEELRAGEETEENWQEEEIPEFFCGTADEEEELLTGTADIQEEEEITAIQGTKGMPEKISASGEEALNKVQSYLRTAVTSPTVSSIGGEWAVLAMARQGMLPEGTRAAYLANLFMTLDSNANGNVLHNIKSTENSRVILALSSIGVNPSSFQGYNLLEPLADMSYVGKQGINGTIFALIALDTKKYEVPKLSAEDIAAGRLQTTRDGLIAEILSREIPGGGWTLSGSQADPDMTGMALQALAPYKERADVKPYVERGIKKLAELRAEDGSYSNGGDKNVESVVQVLVALAALDSSLIENEAFIKNGKTLVDEILLFQVENGSFSHIRGDGGDGMATEQAAYALTAWYRANHGMTSLYNMTDIAADISDENPDDSTDKAPDTVTKEEIEAFRKKYKLFLSE